MKERLVPYEEVLEDKYYDDLAPLMQIFNHEVIEDQNHIWRWRPTTFISLFCDKGIMAFDNPPWKGGRNHTMVRVGLSFNNLWEMFSEKQIPLEELIKIYMQSGYSLDGFCDAFSNAAHDYGLDGSRPVSEKEYNEGGHQTLLDWVVKKHGSKLVTNPTPHIPSLKNI